MDPKKTPENPGNIETVMKEEFHDHRHPFDQVDDAIRNDPNISHVIRVRRDVFWEMTDQGMKPYTGPEYDILGARITPPY